MLGVYSNCSFPLDHHLEETAALLNDLYARAKRYSEAGRYQEADNLYHHAIAHEQPRVTYMQSFGASEFLSNATDLCIMYQVSGNFPAAESVQEQIVVYSAENGRSDQPAVQMLVDLYDMYKKRMAPKYQSIGDLEIHDALVLARAACVDVHDLYDALDRRGLLKWESIYNLPGALHLAARTNAVNLARQQLESQPEVDSMIGDKTALHVAAYYGHAAVLTQLLYAGADIEAGDCHQRRPLHLAAGRGHVDVVFALLSRGAFVDSQDFSGEIPLHYATKSRKLAVYDWFSAPNLPDLYDVNVQQHFEVNTMLVIKMLCEYKTEVNTRRNDGTAPIHLAIRRKSTEAANILLDRGASTSILDGTMSTPLYLALRQCHYKLADRIIQSEKRIDMDDATVSKLLLNAARQGSMETAKILLEAGVDINSTYGLNVELPLYVAAEKNFPDIVRLLIEHGADIEARSRDGNTALHIAALNQSEQALKAILELGAGVNTISAFNGRPALQIAAEKGFLETVRILLGYGANTAIKDSDGRTALYLAAAKGYVKIVKRLLQASLPLSESLGSSIHGSALHVALEAKHSGVAVLLIGDGADPHQKRQIDNKSALDIAKEQGNAELVRIISELGDDISLVS